MGRQSPGLQDRQRSQPECPTCLCLALMDRVCEPLGWGSQSSRASGCTYCFKEVRRTRTSQLSAEATGR